MNNLIWNEKLAIMYQPNIVNIRLTSSIASASSLVLVIFSSLQELGLLESLCFTNRWLARTYKIRGLDPYKCVYAGFRQVLNIARLKFKRIDYHKLLLIKIYPYQCYWAVTNKQVFFIRLLLIYALWILISKNIRFNGSGPKGENIKKTKNYN